MMRPQIATVLASMAFSWQAHAAGAVSLLTVEEGPLKVRIGERDVSLAAVIVKPSHASGRLPIALVAHGSPRDAKQRATYSLNGVLPIARDLAHRGWLAVAFLRRGFGPSQGPFVEGYTCPGPNYRKALATAAEDIEAVLAAVGQRPDADSRRVLGIGVSVGGAAMLAWASTHHEGIVGVVNLSGGTGSFATGRNCDENALITAIGEYGGHSRVPTIWMYAENDGFFGPSLVRRMHGAYTQGGGDAELRIFGPVAEEGHDLAWRFEGKVLWLEALDKFLRVHRLPTWDAKPIDAATKVLSTPARQDLERYLSAPTEKAFSITPGRNVARYWAGMADIDTARKKSLELCERDSRERCEVLLEDFTPVRSPGVR